MSSTDSLSTASVSANTPPAELDTPATSIGSLPSHPGPILCLGTCRTGTGSIAEALKILGYPNIHHGLDIKEHDPQWALLSRAADSTFPTLPTYTGEPFTRAQWDEIFSSYDAVTDVASFFAPSLLQAYPDAPVILVERDIERWAVSIRQIFHPASRPWSRRFVKAVEPVLDIMAASTMLKIITGWTEAARPKDIMTNARTAYRRHYKEVRANVPEERLLDFQLQDGWEPLCRFLGKEVPDVPFPHLNESAAFKEHTRSSANKVLKRAASRVFSRTPRAQVAKE